EVDRLGSAARVDDLLRRRSVDERAHLLARRFVAVGRLLGDLVGRAMDVGVVSLPVVQDRARHLAWALGGVGRVEVGDARLEDGEVLADRGYVIHQCPPPRRGRSGGGEDPTSTYTSSPSTSTG